MVPLQTVHEVHFSQIFNVSCLFSLVFEDEIKERTLKGEKGDQVTISPHYYFSVKTI